MKRYIKQRGFTLIELLIVVIVIAILMTFMMFSMRESETAAQANKIIVSLSSINMAAQTFYLDSSDVLGRMTRAEKADWFSKNGQYIISKYISEGISNSERAKYDVIYDADTGAWYARYSIGTGSATSKLRYELMDRVLNENELGNLLGYDGSSSKLKSAEKYKMQNPYIIIRIR